MTDEQDLVRALFGAHAVHVPFWAYIQDSTPSTVAIVGASRVDSGRHPLRFGSDRTHQLILGDLVVRPHKIVATDALQGRGLAGLVTTDPLAVMNEVAALGEPGSYDVDEMLTSGEVLLDVTR